VIEVSEFNQDNFNKFIEESGVYGFFKEAITLKSGRKSHFYANWRNVVGDVFLTEQLANFVIDFAKENNLEADTFYGVPEGATKLGVITQFLYSKQKDEYAKGSAVLSMGRAKPKDHGAAKDKFFVGMPKGKTIVLEDVTTTGGSLITTLQGLKEAGVEVSGVISLTNRMELRDDGMSVKEAIEGMGLNFYNLSSAIDLLPIMYGVLSPGVDVGEKIEKEFEEFGVEKIKLIK
jgi:orotate phosphoribosyltransferase